MTRLWVLAVIAGFAGCAHEGIINRRYLLDPTMDPSKTAPLGETLVNDPVSAFDVSAQAGQGSMSGACPTCGG